MRNFTMSLGHVAIHVDTAVIYVAPSSVPVTLQPSKLRTGFEGGANALFCVTNVMVVCATPLASDTVCGSKPNVSSFGSSVVKLTVGMIAPTVIKL